jgi:hypothetical protein
MFLFSYFKKKTVIHTLPTTVSDKEYETVIYHNMSESIKEPNELTPTPTNTPVISPVELNIPLITPIKPDILPVVTPVTTHSPLSPQHFDFNFDFEIEKRELDIQDVLDFLFGKDDKV